MWGPSEGTENPQGIWLESQWDLITELHRTGKTDSWRVQQNLVCTRTQERKKDLTADWVRLAGECPRVSRRATGWQWPAEGSGALTITALEATECWHKFFWRRLPLLPIPVHFSSLIPRMSTFTLAISCLTTSNLPWFMDLTFQAPMQYCSLQHRTLLLALVTSTAGYCFCFCSKASFFLELFLHDLQQHTGHLPTWGVPLSKSYHFAFSYCSWGSQGKNTEVVCYSLLQWSSDF